MANKIRLVVGGTEYMVTTDEEESYIRSLGDDLNARIDRIARECPFLSTTMVAVMAALEYCDEAKKARIECEQIGSQLKKQTEDAACARLEADEARREIERLSRENRNLRAGK